MASSSKVPGGATHRAYTLQYKLSVVDWIKRNGSSTRAASKRFGLHRKIVRTWLEKEAELEAAISSMGPQRSRLRVGGRKPLSPELENRLLSWLENRLEDGATVSDRQLQDKALDIAAEMGLANFKASNMWLSRWKRRSNVVCLNGSNTICPSTEPGSSMPATDPAAAAMIRLNADSILSYTDRSEKIRLVYVAEEHQETRSASPPLVDYYHDYSTPEHNYSLGPTDMAHSSIDHLLAPQPDSAPLEPVLIAPIPCHEEVVGSSCDDELDTGSCCVILTKSSLKHKPLQPADRTTISSSSVRSAHVAAAGVAGRMSQPVFNIGPEILFNNNDNKTK